MCPSDFPLIDLLSNLCHLAVTHCVQKDVLNFIIIPTRIICRILESLKVPEDQQHLKQIEIGYFHLAHKLLNTSDTKKEPNATTGMLSRIKQSFCHFGSRPQTPLHSMAILFHFSRNAPVKVWLTSTKTFQVTSYMFLMILLCSHTTQVSTFKADNKINFRNLFQSKTRKIVLEIALCRATLNTIDTNKGAISEKGPELPPVNPILHSQSFTRSEWCVQIEQIEGSPTSFIPFNQYCTF